MIRLYINLVLRTFNKNSGYIILTALSLAIGMTAYMMVNWYVRYETTYEHGIKDYKRTYRMSQVFEKGRKNENEDVDTPLPLGPFMVKNIPNVVNYARINRYMVPREFSSDSSHFHTFHNLYLADSGIFDVLGIKVIAGKPNIDFSQAGRVALSESAAITLFGSTDIIGEKLYTSGKLDCRVAGVFEDITHNTHLPITLVMSMESLKSIWHPKPFELWSLNNSATYIKTKSPIEKLDLFQKKLHTLIADSIRSKEPLNFKTMAIADIHFHSKKPFEFSANGDTRLIYFLQITWGLLIFLTLVCFTNLFAINLTKKAKAITLLKFLGAKNEQLLIQGIIEALVICLPAMVSTIIIVALTSDLISQLSSDIVSIELLQEPWFYKQLIVWLLVALLFAVFLVYTLFYSNLYFGLNSNYLQRISLKTSRIQKVLLGIQLAITLILINGAIFLYLQTDYMISGSTGFDIDRVQVIKLPSFKSYKKRVEMTQAFKSQLESIPTISRVSTSFCLPGTGYSGFNAFLLSSQGDSVRSYSHQCDYDFIPLLDISLLAGRNFDPRVDDHNNIIINDKLREKLGFTSPQKAVGQNIRIHQNIRPTRKIIGVTENVHYLSLKEEQIPLFFRYVQHAPIFALVRPNTTNEDKLISEIQRKFFELFPQRPFKHFLLESAFDKQYEDDIKITQIIGIFSLVAVLLSCSGLFTITLHAMSRRSKEIAIRKVNGGKLRDIFVLLSGEYIQVALVAFLVATPIVYFIMDNWLESFAYRISLDWKVFLLSGLSILVFILLTISHQIYKASVSAPVNSLRYE